MLNLALIAALGLIALLSVPVELSFQVHRNGALRMALAVGWMFGLVKFPVTRSKPQPAARPRPRKRKSAGSMKWIRVMLEPEFRWRLGKLIQQLFAAIGLRDFRLRMRLGFEDPADTGLLWALAGPMIVFLPARLDGRWDLEPEFGGGVFEVDSRGCVRFIPSQLAWVAATFAFSPATLRALWRLRGRA